MAEPLLHVVNRAVAQRLNLIFSNEEPPHPHEGLGLGRLTLTQFEDMELSELYALALE